jgi:hypothetical protein
MEPTLTRLNIQHPRGRFLCLRRFTRAGHAVCACLVMFLFEEFLAGALEFGAFGIGQAR